jgi:hypothetical protein
MSLITDLENLMQSGKTLDNFRTGIKAAIASSRTTTTPIEPSRPAAPIAPAMTPAQALWKFRSLYGAERAAFYRANLSLLQAAVAESTGLARTQAAMEIESATKAAR